MFVLRLEGEEGRGLFTVSSQLAKPLRGAVYRWGGTGVIARPGDRRWTSGGGWGGSDEVRV